MPHISSLAVLQSIYGDNAIHLWHGSRVGSPEHHPDQSSLASNGTDTIRYVVSLKYVSDCFLISYPIFLSHQPPFCPFLPL